MSATTEKPGERLPHLISKLKAPRIAERLGQTATSAREHSWSYEQFLETLLEAEVFARDASGSRNRIRHAAFPAVVNRRLADTESVSELLGTRA